MSVIGHGAGGYSALRRAYRARRPAWVAGLTPAGRQIRAFVARYGLTVLHGPFAGMTYADGSLGHASFLAAKVLGSYELELHEVIEGVIADPPEQIVDVGAAEGYYAVGLALRTGARTHVDCFESDAGGRRLCSTMAELNGVADRVFLRGSCSPETLAATLGEQAFILCDCEGYEFDLLRPDLVPQLASATIVAELHPLAHADIEPVIEQRFSATHEVRLLPMQRRHRASWTELDGWSPGSAFLVLSEGAPSPARTADYQRSWAHMVPKTSQRVATIR